MTTLKQIFIDEFGKEFGELLYSKVRPLNHKWLQQKRSKYPRLGRFPRFVTKTMLVDYVEELTAWAMAREEYTELLEELTVE